MAITTELGFTYAGTHSLDMPVVINRITRPFSMNSSEITQEVNGKNGNVWLGNHNSSISFTIDITVTGDSRTERISNTRTVANWLFQTGDYEEKEIIFDEEPDKAYYGHFVGSPMVADSADWGTTSLTFTCSDPYAYKEQVDTPEYIETPIVLPVVSQVPTKPIINVKVNDDITSLAITNSNNKYIYLGNSVDMDKGQTVSNPYPIVFHDSMTDLDTWESNSGAGYITGSVSGSYRADTNSFSVSSYGTGTGWHGASLKKMNDLGQQVQDFKVDAWVSLKSVNPLSRGLVKIYLLDNSGNSFGYVSLKDNSGDPYAVFQSRAGTDTSGHDVCYASGSTWAVPVQTSFEKRVNGQWRWFTEWVNSDHSMNTFNDFYGVIEVKRVGNVWTATIIGMSSNHMEQYRQSYTWVDSNNQYTSKLGGIAIYSAAYGSEPSMSVNSIADVTAYQVGDTGNNVIPVIASAGDEIMIDCETHKILKNGQLFMNELLIGSTFFDLNPDTEVLGYSPSNKVNLAVSYRPKYM